MEGIVGDRHRHTSIREWQFRVSKHLGPSLGGTRRRMILGCIRGPTFLGLSILSYCKTEMMLVSPTPVSQVDVATAMILKIEALHKGPMRVLDEEFEGAGCCLVAVVVNLTLRPVVG